MQQIDSTKPVAPEDDFEIVSSPLRDDAQSMAEFIESGEQSSAHMFFDMDHRLRVILLRRIDAQSTVRQEWISPRTWWRNFASLDRAVWPDCAIKTLKDPLQALADGWLRADARRAQTTSGIAGPRRS